MIYTLGITTHWLKPDPAGGGTLEQCEHHLSSAAVAYWLTILIRDQESMERKFDTSPDRTSALVMIKFYENLRHELAGFLDTHDPELLRFVENLKPPRGGAPAA